MALLAPIALAVGEKAGVTAFLMAIMLGNGANAGGLSPFAPTGIIANDLMAKIGLVGFEWRNYFNTLIPQSFVAFGDFALGGLKLFARGETGLSRAWRMRSSPSPRNRN